MITFKQYLLEFGDLSNLVTDDIKLDKIARGYECKFYVGANPNPEDVYRVYMYDTHMSLNYGDIEIVKRGDGCFVIGLQFRRNYSLTKKGNSFSVYKMLFKILKKFMDEINPKALYFSGYTDAMDVMYDTFYKKYLAATFMRVESYYLRKDVYETLPENLKVEVQKAINNFDGDYAKRLKRIKANKLSGRQEFIDNKLRLKQQPEPEPTTRQTQIQSPTQHQDDLDALTRGLS
jgi:hypothetical protein